MTVASYRRRRLAGLVVLVLVLAGAPTWAMASRLISLAQAGSPAQGHAQVIAQGVAAPPEGDLVWRVAYHEARLPDDAPMSPRDLGFLLADQGAVMLVGPESGSETHLEPGEAAFVRQGIAQQRQSSADQPASYYAIELVSEDVADDVGNGIAVFSSDPFAAPAGERDIDLVRDIVATDETSTIRTGSTATLVLATTGSMEVTGTNGETVPLKVGEATTQYGDITVKGVSTANAAFVAAIIGPPIGEARTVATPVATPIPTPLPTGPGSISVTLLACPPGTAPDSFNPDQCNPNREAVQLQISILGSGENQRTVETADINAATATWANIPLGTYVLQATDFADGFDRFFVAGLEGLNSPPEEGYTAGPNEGYLLPLSDSLPDFSLDVYAFGSGGAPVDETAVASDDAVNSIAYEVRACPQGIGSDEIDPAACPLATDAAIVAITGGDLTQPLTEDDAVAGDDGRRAWQNLAPGDYIFSHGLPDGYITWLLPETEAATVLPDGSGYAVTLEDGQPTVVLTVYDIVAALGAESTSIPAPPEPEPTPVPAQPTEPPAAPLDTDGDGLSDDEELNIYGTDPGLFDTDGDGFSDFGEVFNGTDPFDPASIPA